MKSKHMFAGDIQELFDTSLKSGHAAAFSDDCDSASAKGIVRGAGNQVHNASCRLILFFYFFIFFKRVIKAFVLKRMI